MNNQNIYQSVVAEMELLRDEYGADSLPDRLYEKAKRILDASSPTEASALAKKTKDSTFIHLLAKWADGKIEGKTTIHSLEVKAKKADNLADFLESQGNAAGAQKQRDRAEGIRAEIEHSLAQLAG